jgi:hypothetical protein
LNSTNGRKENLTNDEAERKGGGRSCADEAGNTRDKQDERCDETTNNKRDDKANETRRRKARCGTRDAKCERCEGIMITRISIERSYSKPNPNPNPYPNPNPNPNHI